jgi:toxin-antitoxin system PIN domain toxin
VILIDVNILIYASLPGFQHHQVARLWLDHQLSMTNPVGIPWATVLAYLRLVTNPRIFTPPVAMAVAWQRVSAWLACDVVWMPQPTERHPEVLARLLVQPGVRGDLVPDAHLAALAIEHGLTLCSTDGDFARFPGLRWLNPLVE